AVSEYRAYVSGGPTFAYRLCAERVTPEAIRGLDLSSWQVAYIGAEPVSPAVLNRFAQAFAACGFPPQAFFPRFGLPGAPLLVPGRCGMATRSLRPDALEQGRAEPGDGGRALVSCGPPPAGVEICIVDPATEQPLPEDRVGEVWVASPSVAGGYWNRPES